jgi:hypothetical protein
MMAFWFGKAYENCDDTIPVVDPATGFSLQQAACCILRRYRIFSCFSRGTC